MHVEPFSVPFSPPAVEDLRDRLRRTRWPDEVSGSQWEYGINLQFLRDICRYWREEYDWEAQVRRLSQLHHYRWVSDCFGIHYVHERGNGPSPMPLILTHGWPGSFVEMLRIIPLLVNPAAYDGDAFDAFDVVVPSLPGFGFSDRPLARGMNAYRVAELWTGLMSTLGYQRFGAQGGDLGAGVATALGLRHADHLIGIHLNFIPGSYGPYVDPGTKLSSAEEEFLTNRARWAEDNGAYSHLQRTRPQTAACGMNDSPSGLAAWILEKFHEWSDSTCDFYQTFSRDELLTNVTLYWMTETIHSSFRMYFENGRAPLQFAREDRVNTPCAIVHFPKEILFPPRSWVERGYNIQRWTEMSRGGHFASMEQPELFAEDIRTFFRRFR